MSVLTLHFIEWLKNKIHQKNVFKIYFWNPSKNYVIFFYLINEKLLSCWNQIHIVKVSHNWKNYPLDNQTVGTLEAVNYVSDRFSKIWTVWLPGVHRNVKKNTAAHNPKIRERKFKTSPYFYEYKLQKKQLVWEGCLDGCDHFLTFINIP